MQSALGELALEAKESFEVQLEQAAETVRKMTHGQVAGKRWQRWQIKNLHSPVLDLKHTVWVDSVSFYRGLVIYMTLVSMLSSPFPPAVQEQGAAFQPLSDPSRDLSAPPKS